MTQTQDSRERKPNRPRVERTCEQCGVSFLVYQTYIDRGGGLFCSDPCMRAAHAPREVACGQCGSPFMAYPSKIAKGDGLFCGRACYYASRKGKATRGPQNSAPIEQRLMKRVQKTESCWFWTGITNEKGYGVFTRKQADGSWSNILAHRMAWEIATGETLSGDDVICHVCDVPGCLRNDDADVYLLNGVEYPRVGHLFKADRVVNLEDMRTKGRQAAPETHSLPGEKNGNAKLTEADVRAIRRLYANGGITQKELAVRYGVVHSLISQIVTRYSWNHVE